MKSIFLIVEIVFSMALTGLLAGAPPALAQQRSADQDNLRYDIYQPSARKRLRRDNCSTEEDLLGAYCVRKCDKGFIAVGNGHPPRCRSIEPLAPGRMPSAIRIQTGSQPRAADTPAATNKPPMREHDPNKQ